MYDIKITGTMVSTHGWETGTHVKLSDFPGLLTVRANSKLFNRFENNLQFCIQFEGPVTAFSILVVTVLDTDRI